MRGKLELLAEENKKQGEELLLSLEDKNRDTSQSKTVPVLNDKKMLVFNPKGKLDNNVKAKRRFVREDRSI